MQVYIVAGGYGSSYLSSTEILEKDGGSEWQLVASLPSELRGPRGLGLDHGQFIITGECWDNIAALCPLCIILNPDILQVATQALLFLMRCSCTTLKRTNGPKWVISPQPGTITA